MRESETKGRGASSREDAIKLRLSRVRGRDRTGKRWEPYLKANRSGFGGSRGLDLGFSGFDDGNEVERSSSSNQTFSNHGIPVRLSTRREQVSEGIRIEGYKRDRLT